jgi:DNA topoisomerase 2-associated protein PAT1
MSISKGKKLLPRILRLTKPQQTLTILTLLVATFDTLDVVKDAAILDGVGSGGGAVFESRRAAVEHETEAFLSSAVPVLMSTIGVAPMRIVTGMVSLLTKRNDVVRVAKSRVRISPFFCERVGHTVDG